MTQQSRKLILIVEDEMLVAMMLESMLEELGCTVLGPARDVEEALELIEQNPALDGAILDVNLGRERSFPVADALADAGVPFVFSTGYGRSTLTETYQSFPILRKPYSPHELRDAMEALMAPARLLQTSSLA